MSHERLSGLNELDAALMSVEEIVYAFRLQGVRCIPLISLARMLSREDVRAGILLEHGRCTTEEESHVREAARMAGYQVTVRMLDSSHTCRTITAFRKRRKP